MRPIGHMVQPASLGGARETWSPSGMSWQPRFFERGARFTSIAAAAARFADLPDWPSVDEIDRRLAADAGVRFVAAPKAPGYTTRIVGAGEVPTRPASWHDYLNALVWATFPMAKRSLTERIHALAAARGRGNRGREEDYLALWDEGGVVVRGAEEIVFGHAIFEHLIRGESVRGLGMRMRPEGSIDERLAAVLTAPFAPETFRVEIRHE